MGATDTRMVTVAEFAQKHCAACGPSDNMPEKVKFHIDMLVEAAMALGYSLWKVVIDDDGRVSLLWSPMPEDAWRLLLTEGLKIQAIKARLGL